MFILSGAKISRLKQFNLFLNREIIQVFRRFNAIGELKHAEIFHKLCCDSKCTVVEPSVYVINDFQYTVP
jgi:hypothetical protein